MSPNAYRDGPEFRFLQRFLQRFSGRAVDYFPNPGNWGDGLIHRSTLDFLESIPLKYRLVERLGEAGDVLIHGGSGAWCPFWCDAMDRVQAAAQRYETVVVLPSTYAVPFAPLANVVYFARCWRSMERLLQNRVPQFYFCHDMAFWLSLQSHSGGAGELRIVRTDAERTTEGHTRDQDLPILRHERAPLEAIIETIDAHERVVTDRLHVAILGVLLGKRVQLHPSAYWKSAGVFEASLRHFANVQFVDQPIG